MYICLYALKNSTSNIKWKINSRDACVCIYVNMQRCWYIWYAKWAAMNGGTKNIVSRTGFLLRGWWSFFTPSFKSWHNLQSLGELASTLIIFGFPLLPPRTKNYRITWFTNFLSISDAEIMHSCFYKWYMCVIILCILWKCKLI